MRSCAEVTLATVVHAATPDCRHRSLLPVASDCRVQVTRSEVAAGEVTTNVGAVRPKSSSSMVSVGAEGSATQFIAVVGVSVAV